MAASTSPVTDRSARYICKSSRSCVGVEPTKEPCPWTVDQMVSAATMPDAVAEPRTPNRSAAQMMSGKMAYSSPVGGRSNAAVRPTRLTSSTPASAARAGGHRGVPCRDARGAGGRDATRPIEQEGAERDAGPEADAEQEERGERDAGGGPGGRDDLLGDGRQQPQLGGTEVDRRYGADLGGIPRPRRHHLAPGRKVTEGLPHPLVRVNPDPAPRAPCAPGPPA